MAFEGRETLDDNMCNIFHFGRDILFPKVEVHFTFGFADAGEAVKFSFLSVAVWWAVFSIPLFVFVKEPVSRDAVYGVNVGTGELFILQARPETVHSQSTKSVMETYVLKETGNVIVTGQAPSDFPEFATFLVECGIDSISLIPDTVIKTRLAVPEKEKELGITPLP